MIIDEAPYESQLQKRLRTDRGRGGADVLSLAPAWSALDTGDTLADTVTAVPDVTTHLDRVAIERLTDPATYPGRAPGMVDRTLSLSARITA